MASSTFILTLLLLGSMLITANADMYYQQKMPTHPGKVIHVHHYDAGGSNMHMKPMYKKGGGGGGFGGGSGDLFELLILSSLLGGNGLFGNTNAANNPVVAG